MLMRTDPFRDLDRLAQQLVGAGTSTRPSVMPLDAWREGDAFVLEFDLPGVQPETLDIDVERNVLTVRAERPPKNGDWEMLAAERPTGLFSRQLVLGDNLDLDRLEACYDAGVLRLTVPVAERAKPRKIEVTTGGRQEDHRDRGVMRTMAPAGPGVPRAVTHGAQATSTEAWLDLVVAEDDWVRREFEEVVAAGWDGEVPTEPPTARGGGRPQRPRRHRRRWLVSEPATNAPRPPAGACERGPPPPRARQAHRSADYFSADHGSLPVEHVRAHVEGLLAPGVTYP